MVQTANDPRLSYRFAPIIRHESVEKMSPAQKDQALHELIDLRDTVKGQIYSPQASPQTRLIALDLLMESIWRTRGRKGEPPLMEAITDTMPVHYPTVAKRLGIHRNSVGKEYKAFHKVGLLHMTTRTDEEGRDHVDVAINQELPTHADRLPAKGERPRPAPGFKSAGTGKHCAECGSGNVTTVCRDCGHVEELGEFPHEDEQPVEEVAILPSTPPLAQEDETLSTREVLREDGLRNSTREVLSVSTQEVEQAAAQLLVAIAGEHAQHIEMSRTSERAKYFTVHTPLTDKELLAHLRGATTKGVFNRSLDGMTRAICFDGDTPEAWQGLIEAAGQLAAADDFKPIIEPSPAPGEHAGGGHLWIIYSDLVDSYSALQTLYQYVPGLRQYKEHWPGGGINMRLPGGKYVRPGFEAECHLFDENMQNGIGTAAMLIERQTPAGVVRAYTRSEPQREQRPHAGGYLESDSDLGKQIIDEFNAARDWGDIAALAGGFVHGKFPAIWRGEQVPSVAIWRKTDLAKDFGAPGEPAMDKYDAWCHIEAHYRGMDWREFKRLDLADRAAYRRAQQERRAS